MTMESLQPEKHVSQKRKDLMRRQPRLRPREAVLNHEICRNTGVYRRLSMNREIAVEFLRQLDREGVGERRKKRYMDFFHKLDVAKIDLESLDAGSVDDLFFYIKSLPLSDETRLTYWKMTKRLCRWLKIPVDPTYRIKLRDKEPDLLTPEEVMKMFSCCRNFRHRLIIMLLYESGCRIDELLTLRRDAIAFDSDGCVLNVSGKTGNRPVRLIRSAPMLKSYLDMFQDTRPFSMTPQAVLKVLKEAARKAGITKRVYSHLFRHTSATYWARFLTDREMCLRFGWSKTSKQPARYAHLSMRDIDDKVVSVGHHADYLRLPEKPLLSEAGTGKDSEVG